MSQRMTAKGESVSFHCVDCGSDDILLVGANCSWNFSEQRFEYHHSADPSWTCTECGNFNWQIESRIVKEDSGRVYSHVYDY
jgi:RNase P subunit RPR2